jgi:hypothetical protein
MRNSLTDWRENIQRINLSKIIIDYERRPYHNPLNFKFPSLHIPILKNPGRGSIHFYRRWRLEIQAKILAQCDNRYVLIAWPDYVVEEIQKQGFSKMIAQLRSRINHRFDPSFKEMRQPGSHAEIAKRIMYFLEPKTQDYLLPYVLGEISSNYTWDVSSEHFSSTLTQLCDAVESICAGIWASRHYRDNVLDWCISPRGYGPLKKCASVGEITEYLDKRTSEGRWMEEKELKLLQQQQQQQQQAQIETEKKKSNQILDCDNKQQEMQKRWQKYHSVCDMMSAYDKFNDFLQSSDYTDDEFESNKVLQRIAALESDGKNKNKNGFPEFWTILTLDLVLRLKLSVKQNIGDNSFLCKINDGDDIYTSGLPLVTDYFDEIVDGTPIQLSKACNVIDTILGELPTRTDNGISTSNDQSVQNVNDEQGAGAASNSANTNKTGNSDNSIPLSERLQLLPRQPKIAAPSPPLSTPQPALNRLNDLRKRAADEMDNSKNDEVKEKDKGNSIEIIGTSKARSKAQPSLRNDSVSAGADAGVDKLNDDGLSGRIKSGQQQHALLSKPALTAPAALLQTKALPTGPASTMKPAPVSVYEAEPKPASASSPTPEPEENRLAFVNDEEEETAATEEGEENELDGVLSLSTFSKSTTSATIMPNFVGITSTQNIGGSDTLAAINNNGGGDNNNNDDDDDDSFLLETMRRKKPRLF